MRKNKIEVLKKLACEYMEDVKDFSIAVATGRLVSKVNIPFVSYERRNSFFWNIVYKYMKKEYSQVIKKAIENDMDYEKSDDGIIWTMWWQGETQMPEVISVCYHQLLKAAEGKRKVVLITQQNFSEYVHIPPIIIKKFEAQQISITHLSDVVRCYLLRNYGGLWLDASIFAGNLDMITKGDFFTLRTANQLTNYYSKGNWSTFVLYYKNNNSLLMRCMCEVYESYWTDHNKTIVYELPDYIIQLCYEYSDTIREQIDCVEDSYDYRELLGIMNDPYNQSRINEILHKCSLQKMSYKYKVVKELNNRQITNFGHLYYVLGN